MTGNSCSYKAADPSPKWLWLFRRSSSNRAKIYHPAASTSWSSFCPLGPPRVSCSLLLNSTPHIRRQWPGSSWVFSRRISQIDQNIITFILDSSHTSLDWYTNKDLKLLIFDEKKKVFLRETSVQHSSFCMIQNSTWTYNLSRLLKSRHRTIDPLQYFI